MRDTIIGLVIGTVIGVIAGVEWVAPRLPPDGSEARPPAAVPPPAAVDAARLPDRPRPRAEVDLDMASAFASGVPHFGALARRVADEVWRVTAGRVELEFHEPGALAPAHELLGAVASGAVDAAFASPGMWGDEVPALQLFGAVPFGPDARETLAWFDSGGGRAMFEEIYRERGVHSVLCGLVAPTASLWVRREIAAPEDLRGLAVVESGLGAKVLERLGAEVRRLSAADTFVALETGAVDGVAGSLPDVDRALGLPALARHAYFPAWQRPVTLLELMVSRDRWESFSAADRARIEAVCGDNVRHGLAVSEAAQFGALKALFADGVQLHRWSPSLADAFRRAWEDVAGEEAGADPEFRRVWRSLRAFRGDYAIWREISQP